MTQILGSDGNAAEVDGENRLQTYSTTQNLAETLLLKGLLSSIFFQVTPAGAGDYFFYMKNTGTVDIGFNMIQLSSSVPTKVLIERVIGTPVYVGETDAEVSNLNLSSALSPTMEAKFDTDITGLTKTGHLVFMEAAVADTEYESGVFGGLIIPQGAAVAFNRVEATGLITINLSLGVLSF